MLLLIIILCTYITIGTEGEHKDKEGKVEVADDVDGSYENDSDVVVIVNLRSRI